MIAPAAAAGDSRSWTHVLLSEVRPGFRAEVYVPEPDDLVLIRRAPGDAPLALGPAAPCAVADCRRSVHLRGLCTTHHMRFKARGEPELEDFLARETPARAGRGGCLAPGCAFPPVPRRRLCDTHQGRCRTMSARGLPGGDPELYAARLRAAHRARAPRFDSRGLARPLQLELQSALQRRSDARGAKLTARVYGAVVGWAREAGVASLLDEGDGFWKRSASELRRPVRAPALAFVRFARHELQSLREREQAGELYQWDAWPVDLLDGSGRWAHQPTRRIYFTEVEPGWLRALAKRWARWRLAAGSMSPATVNRAMSALRHLSRFAAERGELPQRPGELTRELLERFMAAIRATGLGEPRKRSILIDLKIFLDDVRRHGWEPGLPVSAGYHRGELPRVPRALPRFIDEFVMAQIESKQALSKLPDQTTRTLVVLLMETGLRSVDAMRLPFEPVTRDQAGAPYLVFWNHKAAREAVVPISERLLAEIRRQQAELRERFADGPPPVLFPRPWRNTGGREPLELTTLNRRLRRWLKELEVRDAAGRPVEITSHQFRHTLGTRLVNNEVPLDTIRRLLDHSSPAMTAVYAHVKDQTLRREWERYQERINIRGELIPLDREGPLSDAAWAKENLARAKQTLPNGYCGLPLQQSCPHPNACLTCDHFLTTEEFLPQHREQLGRTERLLADAERNGNQRLVEINTPVRLNLLRIIEGLEALQPHELEEADAA